MECRAKESGKVSRRGQPSIEWYKDGKPQYYCYGYIDKMTDTEHVYSNGTEYVPIYRMKQWFEHCRNQQLLAGEEDKHD